MGLYFGKLNPGDGYGAAGSIILIMLWVSYCGGGSLKINALTAILSLFIGAAVWGLAGMILFLPFAAMLKVVCEEFEELKPIALIIGEKNIKESDGHEQFLSRWWRKIKDGFRNN